MRLRGFTVLGELGLDGSIAPVAGVLPAAIGANSRDEGLICPAACGAEAAWASPDIQIVAASSLIQIANHFKGTQVLSRPQPKVHEAEANRLDLRDIKGQESAKRALEIAAAGGHHLLMIGSPGAGKSMLAARLPSILPPLSPSELLEVSMIASVAGEIRDGALTARRPFRSPHHSASMAALTGGGMRAKPGEISLAHQGVLFLDELPEFDARVLDSLRQPMENGEVAVSRANHRVTYPARFMLVAAMNPCRCGHAYEPGYACKRGRVDRCTGGLSGAHLRPADGSHRPAHRGAGGDRRRPDPAAAGGRLGGSRRTRRRGARHPARALRRRRPAAGPHQCRSAGLGAGANRAAGRAGHKTAARRRPRPCGCRRAAITACCASPARWPTSTASDKSAGCIWPKRCPIARWPRICAARRRAFSGQIESRSRHSVSMRVVLFDRKVVRVSCQLRDIDRNGCRGSLGLLWNLRDHGGGAEQRDNGGNPHGCGDNGNLAHLVFLRAPSLNLQPSPR